MKASGNISRGHGSLILTVASLSFVLLGFQISLMRLLSYTQWYHFASMIISLALLGFGAAGTVLSIAGGTVVRRGMPMALSSSLACPLLIALSPTVMSLLPIDPFLLLSEGESVVRLTLLVAFLVVAFFAGALVIGLSFQLYPERIGRLYGANLAGSAVGTIGAVLFLEVVPPERLPQVLALLVLPSVWILAIKERSQRTVTAAVTVAIVVLFLAPVPVLPMSQFKPLSRALLLAGSRLTGRVTNSLGVLEIVEGPALRYAPGVSLTFQGDIPTHNLVFQDGELVGPLIGDQDSTAWPVYRRSAAAFPYCFGVPDRALVLAAGTGVEMLLARDVGSQIVTGVELNPELVRMFAERHPVAVEHRVPAVMVHDEARSFLQRDTTTYGLIVLPILEGQTANAAGTHALFENYLLTVEAFSLMFRRLENTGILVIHAWMNTPPRGSAKILSTMIEALRANGIRDPGAHLSALRSWNTVAIAVSRQPLTKEQGDRVRRFSKEMGFDLVCLPGLTEEDANHFHRLERPYLFEAGRALLGESWEEFQSSYPFRVEPATDDRPYFSNFLAWGDLPRALEMYPSGEIPYLELGTFFLAVTVVLVGSLSAILIGIPFVLVKRVPASRGVLGRSLVYFGGLGLGYMIMEMIMIQKTILFLGDPIYAVAIVVASLLVSSSLGSAFSPSLEGHIRRHPWLLPTTLLGLLVLYAVALSPLMSAALAWGMWTRRLLLPLVLLPVGVVLGVPFPLGLSRVAQRAPAAVPLAWAINGYAAVLAASTAVLASMELGFGRLQVIALLAYAAAFATGHQTRHR